MGRRTIGLAAAALAALATALVPGVAGAQAPYSAAVVEQQITGPRASA